MNNDVLKAQIINPLSQQAIQTVAVFQTLYNLYYLLFVLQMFRVRFSNVDVRHGAIFVRVLCISQCIHYRSFSQVFLTCSSNARLNDIIIETSIIVIIIQTRVIKYQQYTITHDTRLHFSHHEGDARMFQCSYVQDSRKTRFFFSLITITNNNYNIVTYDELIIIQAQFIVIQPVR